MEQNKNIQPKNEKTQVTEADYKSRISELEKELKKAQEELKETNQRSLQNYRQADMLKKTLKAIIENHELKIAEVYETIIESNALDLDCLLLYLSK